MISTIDTTGYYHIVPHHDGGRVDLDVGGGGSGSGSGSQWP
jgi:hypothetical protein